MTNAEPEASSDETQRAAHTARIEAAVRRARRVETHSLVTDRDRLAAWAKQPMTFGNNAVIARARESSCPASVLARRPSVVTTWQRMMVRPVPTRRPTRVVTAAPMTAPTPPAAPTSPNWNALTCCTVRAGTDWVRE